MKRNLKHYSYLISFNTLLIVVLLLTGVLQFFIMFNTVKSDTYDIQLTQIAEETVRATKTVEDVELTEKARDEAEKLVEPVYIINSDVAEQRASFIHSVFEVVLDVKKQLAELEQPISKDERVAMLQTALKDITNYQQNFTLTDIQLDALLVSTEEELKRAQGAIEPIIKTKLSEPIRSEEVRTVKAKLATEVSELSAVSR